MSNFFYNNFKKKIFFSSEDLCEPNPCGANAICIPGHDRSGQERPVCNCLPGYTGNPLTHCTRVR